MKYKQNFHQLPHLVVLWHLYHAGVPPQLPGQQLLTDVIPHHPELCLGEVERVSFLDLIFVSGNARDTPSRSCSLQVSKAKMCNSSSCPARLPPYCSCWVALRCWTSRGFPAKGSLETGFWWPASLSVMKHLCEIFW